jgi:tetratricopeptide (TPR) repeat protein
MELAAVASLAALLLVFVAAPAQAADSVAAVLAEAQTALVRGDATTARRLADDALKTPDLGSLTRARLLLDRGLAFELMDARDKALIDFTTAIDTHALPAAEQAQALLQRGFLLDSQGRTAAALGDYTAVIKLTPDHAQTALNNRANIYRRQNKLELARRDYLAALKNNPRAEYPYTGLGQIAEAEGDTDTARRYYAKAIAANAHYALAINRLAALGGPLPDTPDVQEPIHLHPPPGMVASAPAAFVVAPAAVSPKAPIHLHMPAAKKSSGHRKAPPLRPAIDGGPDTDAAAAQIGSWRSRAEAETGWTQAVAQAGGALDGLAHTIQAADLAGRGRFYRLRARPGPTGARALCERLRTRAMDCLVVRN